jgi:hypothetical protein
MKKIIAVIREPSMHGDMFGRLKGFWERTNAAGLQPGDVEDAQHLLADFEREFVDNSSRIAAQLERLEREIIPFPVLSFNPLEDQLIVRVRTHLLQEDKYLGLDPSTTAQVRLFDSRAVESLYQYETDYYLRMAESTILEFKIGEIDRRADGCAPSAEDLVERESLTTQLSEAKAMVERIRVFETSIQAARDLKSHLREANEAIELNRERGSGSRAPVDEAKLDKLQQKKAALQREVEGVDPRILSFCLSPETVNPCLRMADFREIREIWNFARSIQIVKEITRGLEVLKQPVNEALGKSVSGFLRETESGLGALSSKFSQNDLYTDPAFPRFSHKAMAVLDGLLCHLNETGVRDKATIGVRVVRFTAPQFSCLVRPVVIIAFSGAAEIAELMQGHCTGLNQVGKGYRLRADEASFTSVTPKVVTRTPTKDASFTEFAGSVDEEACDVVFAIPFADTAHFQDVPTVRSSKKSVRVLSHAGHTCVEGKIEFETERVKQAMMARLQEALGDMPLGYEPEFSESFAVAAHNPANTVYSPGVKPGKGVLLDNSYAVAGLDEHRHRGILDDLKRHTAFLEATSPKKTVGKKKRKKGGGATPMTPVDHLMRPCSGCSVNTSPERPKPFPVRTLLGPAPVTPPKARPAEYLPELLRCLEPFEAEMGSGAMDAPETSIPRLLHELEVAVLSVISSVTPQDSARITRRLGAAADEIAELVDGIGIVAHILRSDDLPPREVEDRRAQLRDQRDQLSLKFNRFVIFLHEYALQPKNPSERDFEAEVEGVVGRLSDLLESNLKIKMPITGDFERHVEGLVMDLLMRLETRFSAVNRFTLRRIRAILERNFTSTYLSLLRDQQVEYDRVKPAGGLKPSKTVGREMGRFVKEFQAIKQEFLLKFQALANKLVPYMPRGRSNIFRKSPEQLAAEKAKRVAEISGRLRMEEGAVVDREEPPVIDPALLPYSDKDGISPEYIRDMARQRALEDRTTLLGSMSSSLPDDGREPDMPLSLAWAARGFGSFSPVVTDVPSHLLGRTVLVRDASAFGFGGESLAGGGEQFGAQEQKRGVPLEFFADFARLFTPVSGGGLMPLPPSGDFSGFSLGIAGPRLGRRKPSSRRRLKFGVKKGALAAAPLTVVATPSFVFGPPVAPRLTGPFAHVLGDARLPLVAETARPRKKRAASFSHVDKNSSVKPPVLRRHTSQ